MIKNIFIAYNDDVDNQVGLWSAESAASAISNRGEYGQSSVSLCPLRQVRGLPEDVVPLFLEWRDLKLRNSLLITVDAMSTLAFAALEKQSWFLFDPYDQLQDRAPYAVNAGSFGLIVGRLHNAIARAKSIHAGSLEPYCSLRTKHTNYIDYKPYPIVTKKVSLHIGDPIILFDIRGCDDKYLSDVMASINEVVRGLSVKTMIYKVSDGNSESKKCHGNKLGFSYWIEGQVPEGMLVHVVVGDVLEAAVGARLIDSWRNQIPVVHYSPQYQQDGQSPIKHGVTGLFVTKKSVFIKLTRRLINDRNYANVVADRAFYKAPVYR